MIEPKHQASLLTEEKSLWAGQMFVIMLITLLLNIKGDYFRFGLVFIKKSNQNRFLKKKKKPKPVQTDRFRVSYVQLFWGKNRFGSVFFRFDFFGFRLIKPKPNQSVFSKL
jgi:hypothetical protein